MVSSRQLVELYARSTTSGRPVSVHRLVSDRDDDVVIATAIAAQADLIVTGGKALLLVEEFHGVRIVSAVGALRPLTSA
jgi:predicted nucleic acid-binding protein